MRSHNTGPGDTGSNRAALQLSLPVCQQETATPYVAVETGLSESIFWRVGGTDRVSVHSPACPGTSSIAQCGLKQRSTCLCVSGVGNKGVRLKASLCTSLSPGCAGMFLGCWHSWWCWHCSFSVCEIQSQAAGEPSPWERTTRALRGLGWASREAAAPDGWGRGLTTSQPC